MTRPTQTQESGTGRPGGAGHRGRPSRVVTAPAPGAAQGRPSEVARQYVTFNFYQFTEAYHGLTVEQRGGIGRELVDLIGRWDQRSEAKEDVILRTYSLAGLRADTDMMLWLITQDLDLHQAFSSELTSAGLTPYLACKNRFLSQTKRSQYVVKLDVEHGEEESRHRILPGNRDYIFVYPFVKTRDWYLLSQHVRQGIMDEHIEVGTRYRSVKLNTTYSFGLDDQDFVVAFETDNPGDFLDLVQELRATESSRYTQRDTPMYTCRRMEIDKIVGQFGAG